MKLEQFDYQLDEKFIASVPLKDRTNSKMMIVDVIQNSINDDTFKNIVNYFKKGDVLVRNNSKVIPARLFAHKKTTGGKVEILLLKKIDDTIYECLVGGAKKIKLGDVILFENNKLKAICIKVENDGIRHFRFEFEGDFEDILNKIGQIPLPPYIKVPLKEKERYQTVYAKHLGSSAAPTAGLHFNEKIIAELVDKGVIIVDVTLHVGLGTFKNVETENIEEHRMHEEFYSIDRNVADILNDAKKENRRIIAIGTTSVRVLESNWKKFGKFNEYSGYTNIFIYPGIAVESVDALLTNFHLPKSTLLMLVSAFANIELIKNAYQKAIALEYRFFSFGDCMLIVR